MLGIPGTNDQGIGDQRYAGYPQFNMGFAAVGNRDGWNPIYRDERTYSLATNLTKVAGRHDIRGGYFLNFLYLDHWQPETGNPRGNFTFNANTTGLRGGQTTNFYNQYASFLLGLVGNANKSVQNELMTSREWQHALYIRDRWNVNSRLTLDLGLRWEYYPIMARADGRGLDRLDLSNLEVIVAGRGGNPQTNGMSAGLDNFAPRIGGVFRLNDQTVFRSGYGITYNAQAWARAVRGDNDYPVTIAGTFVNPEQFAWYGTLQQGIPFMTGPDLSSGRVPLDRSAAEYTPEIDNIDRGYIHTWNVAFERRLPWNTSVDVAYVGAKGVGGYAALDINAPLTLGGGDNSRPYASFNRFVAINSWGARLPTKYQSLQVALNKPFTKRLMFKGAYTLSKAMNETDADGRATLTWNTPSELWRNWAPAGFDRRHNFQMGFAYALPWQSDGSYDSVAKAILGDWQLNGIVAAFTGTPYRVSASGTVVEHAVQRAERRSGRRLQHPRQHRQRRQVVRHRGVRAADRRPLRQHGPQPVLRSGRVDRRPVDLPVVRDGRPAAARSPVPGKQHLQSPGLRQSGRDRSRPAPSARSPASTATAPTSNGSSRSGVRFTF